MDDPKDIERAKEIKHRNPVLPADQYSGSVRDSDVKFQCRLIIASVAHLKLPVQLEAAVLEPVHEIVRLENARLEKLTKSARDLEDQADRLSRQGLG